MGLELNLKDLSGKAIRVIEKITEKADLDKNGKVDFDNAEENTIFARELKEQYKKGNLTRDEFKQLEKPVEAEELKEIEPTKKEIKRAEKQAKKDEERAQEIYLRYIEDITEGGGTREDLLELLDEKVGSQKDNPTYIKLREAVADVLAAVEKVPSKTPYEVDHNTDEVRDLLKADNKNDKLHKEILENVEKIQKTEMRYAAYREISDIYNNIVRQDDEAGVGKRNDEYIMKDVIAELKKQNKYKNGKRKNDYENPYVAALKVFEKDRIMGQATTTMIEAITDIDDNTKWRSLRKEAKANLTEEGLYDKYVEEAFEQKSGDAISGKKSTSRIVAERQARKNNVDLSSVQSKEEILDALGRKSEVFEALVSQGLITEREDSYYDMTKLQEVLLLQVGNDYKQARDAKKDEAISEKLSVLSQLAHETKLDSLSESEAKELLLLAGFDKENKDWGRIILETIFGGIVGAAAGAGVEATNPTQRKVITPDMVLDNALDGNYEIRIPINNEININGPLKDFVTITQTGEILIQLKDLFSGNPLVVEFIKQVPLSALKHGLIGAAASFLNALPDKGAIPVTVTQFETTDINEYLNTIAKRAPKYTPALAALAMAYVDKDGNWDVEGFKQHLNRLAGNGHFLERDELVGIEIPEQEVTEVEETEEAATPAKNDVIAEGESSKEKAVETAVPTTDGRKTSWTKLAQSYECLVEKYGLKKAIRILKIAQAITDGNYTEARMEELYNLSLKGASKLKNIEGVNYEIYHGALMGTDLSRYQYDKDGNLIPGTGVKVPAELAGCRRNEEMDTSDKYTGEGPAKYVAPKGHAADTTTEHFTVPVWGIKVNDDPIEVYYDKATSDRRFAEAKEQCPNAKVEKLTREEINEAMK